MYSNSTCFKVCQLCRRLIPTLNCVVDVVVASHHCCFLQACSLGLTCECVYLSCVPLLRQKWRTRSFITKTWRRYLRLKPFMKCRGQTSGPMSQVTDTAPMTGSAMGRYCPRGPLEPLWVNLACLPLLPNLLAWS